MKNKIFDIHIDSPFAGAGEDRISTTVHKECNIETIQLEISTRLLKDRFEDVLESLVSFVTCYDSSLK